MKPKVKITFSNGFVYKNKITDDIAHRFRNYVEHPQKEKKGTNIPLLIVSVAILLFIYLFFIFGIRITDDRTPKATHMIEHLDSCNVVFLDRGVAIVDSTTKDTLLYTPYKYTIHDSDVIVQIFRTIHFTQ